MLISSEVDYAIRMIRALADGRVKTATQICDEEKLPKPFAYKILKKLEQARLVQPLRGINGGYRLTKKVSKITLFDVLLISANNVAISKCLQMPEELSTRDKATCVIQKEYIRLENAFKSILSERSIQDIFNAG